VRVLGVDHDDWHRAEAQTGKYKPSEHLHLRVDVERRLVLWPTEAIVCSINA